MKQNELARLLGITPAMVSKLAKRGMPTDSLERAARWRRRHLELPRTKAARPSAARSRDEATPGGDDVEGVDPDADSADYRLARAQRERTRAEREQLELDKLRGSLISVEEICRIEFTSMRVLRDRLQSLPPAISAVLFGLAKSGAEPHEVELAVGREIDQALRDVVSTLDALAEEEREREQGEDDDN